MKNENQNIPELSVTAVVDLLTKLYVSAVNKRTAFKDLSTPFLWGAAGVGKSESVRQLAQRLEQATGKRVVVTDVRLYLYSPVDVRGVLVADERREFTKWLRPKIFDMDPSEDVINLLFLDELSAAPQSVQVVAYQISLDRAVGEHSLPDNCIVIGAGNRTTDQSISYRMPKALCNRMKHFCIRPDYESWRAWAVENGVEPLIIGFLASFHDRLCMEPQTSDLAYPTPRSWKFVSNDLQMMCGDSRQVYTQAAAGDQQLHELISSNVGVDTAMAFEKWCRVYSDLPSVEEILQGRCRTYPRDHEVLYALVASLTVAIRNRGEQVDEAELENACRYARRFPEDFVTSFFMDLRAMEKLHRKLMNCPSMKEWVAKKGQFL